MPNPCEHGNRVLADGRIEKTVALIGHTAQETYNEKNRHAELLAGHEQAVTRHVDAGIFHVHGGLLAAEGRADGDRHRFLFARHRD